MLEEVGEDVFIGINQSLYKSIIVALALINAELLAPLSLRSDDMFRPGLPNS